MFQHSSESSHPKDFLTLPELLTWLIALDASFLGVNTVHLNFFQFWLDLDCSSEYCSLLLSFVIFYGARKDGIFLMEVDRVLRPGGYWILSGPPIHWKKHWKGWERTMEDLNSEQTTIENVAKSLCWKKLVEKDDIAIWQKPTNHFSCRANRKLAQNPPFCPAQDPNKAWYVLLFIHLSKSTISKSLIVLIAIICSAGIQIWRPV